MILAVAVLVVAAFAAVGPRSVTKWARSRYLVTVLALSAAAGAVYDAVRGSWLGATILLAAAVWIGADSRMRPSAPAPAMSRADAAAALGVSETATKDEIESAFRRLMQRVHPDHGGAPGLAAQLNAARTTLLRKT